MGDALFSERTHEELELWISILWKFTFVVVIWSIYRFKEIGGHFKIYAFVVETLYKVPINAYSMIISLFNLTMEFGGIF